MVYGRTVLPATYSWKSVRVFVSPLRSRTAVEVNSLSQTGQVSEIWVSMIMVGPPDRGGLTLAAMMGDTRHPRSREKRVSGMVRRGRDRAGMPDVKHPSHPPHPWQAIVRHGAS